jgi:hypothetical protein
VSHSRANEIWKLLTWILLHWDDRKKKLTFPSSVLCPHIPPKFSEILPRQNPAKVLWDKQKMRRSFGMDVMKSKNRIIFVCNCGRNLFAQNFMEDSVGHIGILAH